MVRNREILFEHNKTFFINFLFMPASSGSSKSRM
jgi:hypothetical protein